MKNLKSLLAALSAVALMGAGCLNMPPKTDSDVDVDVVVDEEMDTQEDEEMDEDEDAGRIMADVESRTVVLNEQNDSGETGSLTLTEEDGKTRAVLVVNGQAAGAKQPAHIHTGSCATIGAVLHPLSLVVNGRSETLIDAKLADLLGATTDISVNVHMSETDLPNYVACGDINAGL